MERDFDNFDEFAKDYRDIHNENIKLSGVDSDYFAEYKVKEVLKKESDQSLKILDIGCGDGISAVFFNKYFAKHSYTGIDISEESIKEAEARKEPNSTFGTYDGLTIPFKDEEFDIVFIACVMHHIMPKHHVQLLTDIKRVLKKSGRLYIFEHNPYNPITLKVVRDCVFDKDAILLTPPYSRKILKAAGFNKVNMFFTIFFPRKGFFKKILGLEAFLTWLPLGGQYFVRVVKQN
jgi:ubiquinone/menaquinone biosynthesis C-methylase UbiE